MKLKQLSVFLENKPGCLRRACSILADNHINLITLSLADSDQFGILRIIVDNVEKAKAVLDTEGFVSKISDVIAVEVPDEPGGLNHVLKVVEDAGIGVEYMYAFTIKKGENAVMLFYFSDVDKAIRALQNTNFTVLAGCEIFRRASC